MTYSPVSLANPEKIFKPFCVSLNVTSWSICGVGTTCMIVESYTRQYTKRWKDSCEILHLKSDMWPVYLRQFGRGELTMYHITGSDPFTWTNPCRGVFIRIAHMSPLQVLTESTKAVITKCIMFLRVVNLHWIRYLGNLSLCKARDAIPCITKSQLEIWSTKMLGAVTFFCIPRSQNMQLFRYCTSTVFVFRLPYCSGSIPSNSYSCFIQYRPRDLLCIFASI